MIAAAGGAAGAAGIGERRAQEAEVKQYEEANRQAQLMLAKLGFDVGSQNVGIQNENLGISDAGKLRDYTVAQGNKQGPRNTAVQQMEQDWKAAAENIQAQNRTNTTRGQVGISAMDAAASAQNRATTRQEEITASGANKGHELDTQSLLDSVGVPRNLAAKDQAKYAPAVAAASALHPSTQNIDAALNALADELADPKFADLVLSSAPGEPKPETAAKKAAMEAISPRQGLKANPPAAAATISALFASARQRPNGDSELYEKVIKPAAARGSYVAKLLLKKVAPQKVPAGAK